MQDLDIEAKYFINVDIDSDYFQVVAEYEARKILSFLTPDGNIWRKVMPMEALNVDPTFASTMMKLQMECDTVAKENGLKTFVSKLIVDCVLLYGLTEDRIIVCFRKFLDILKHHCAKLKLKRYNWIQFRCKVLGMDVAAGETQPAQSKNVAFSKLERPNTW